MHQESNFSKELSKFKEEIKKRKEWLQNKSLERKRIGGKKVLEKP